MAADTRSLLLRDERSRELAVEPNLVEIVAELDSDVSEKQSSFETLFAIDARSQILGD